MSDVLKPGDRVTYGADSKGTVLPDNRVRWDNLGSTTEGPYHSLKGTSWTRLPKFAVGDRVIVTNSERSDGFPRETVITATGVKYWDRSDCVSVEYENWTFRQDGTDPCGTTFTITHGDPAASLPVANGTAKIGDSVAWPGRQGSTLWVTFGQVEKIDGKTLVVRPAGNKKTVRLTKLSNVIKVPS